MRACAAMTESRVRGGDFEGSAIVNSVIVMERRRERKGGLR